jgi:iron complex transport system substrate-binding protein
MRNRRSSHPTPRHAVTFVAALSIAISGCGDGDDASSDAAGTRPPSTSTSFPVTVTDVAGSKIRIPARPERIVALFDVNVNTLDELDVDERIVGLDDFASVPDGTDEDVPRIGGDGFVFDAEAVVALEPDLVITSTGTEELLDQQLRNADIQVLSLGYPASVDASLELIETLGTATGEADAALELVDELRRGLDAVAAVAADVDDVPTYFESDASVAGKPFTVGAGSLVHELLALAGAENVFADDGVAPQTSFEGVVTAAPEVILLGNAKGHVGPNFLGAIEPTSLAERPGFDTVPAVRDDRVVPVDADELLVPGPRLAEGLAQLVGAVHPDLRDAALEALDG